jgi:hypothetical protein
LRIALPSQRAMMLRTSRAQHERRRFIPDRSPRDEGHCFERFKRARIFVLTACTLSIACAKIPRRDHDAKCARSNFCLHAVVECES